MAVTSESAPTQPPADPPAGPPGTVGPWLPAVALANLVAQVGIVVTGGLVRLTGSGLGCPTWPQCVRGSLTPTLTQPQGWHKYVEFGNRALTGVLVAVAAASLLAVLLHRRRHRSGGRRLLLLGAFPLLAVFAQAVLGGITVLMHLNPATVAAHFLLSMVIIAGATLFVTAGRRERAGAAGAGLLDGAPPEADAATGPVGRAELGWLARAVAVTAAVVLVLGTVVTGSGPHSGDVDARSRFGFDPKSVAWLHADAVWLFCGLVVALLVGLRLAGAGRTPRRWALALLVVTLGQGVIGYIQYATNLPIAVVALHMFGASALVVAVTGTYEAATRGPA